MVRGQTPPGLLQHLATGLTVGKRFHSAPVVRLADAAPMPLSRVLGADGRWRLIAFAGAEDDGGPDGPVAALAEFFGRVFTDPSAARGRRTGRRMGPATGRSPAAPATGPGRRAAGPT